MQGPTFVFVSFSVLFLTKQAMLEVQNLTKRANMLLDDLTKENDRLDLIKQALGGKQDEDLGFN